MAYDRLSKYKTKVERDVDGKAGRVTYHRTPIVEWSSQFITLRSGGWQSVTTKRKMNQASHQFGLGYSVFQRDFEWFVVTPHGDTAAYPNLTIWISGT
jgi:hypothetical protein